MPYGPRDNGTHQPVEGDPTWQESVFVSWYDVRTRSGGYHHVDFQPHRQRCCVWSWTAAEGSVTSRYQSLNAPLAPDVADFTVGPLSWRTRHPLSSYALDVTAADSAITVESTAFEAFTPLLYQRMAEDGSPADDHGSVGLSDYGSQSTGHYEAFGRVRGSVAGIDGRTRVVDGYGFQDHSWGPRQYGRLTSAHRFIHATFGTDLFASLYAMSRDASSFNYGYVFDRGSFHSVDDIEVEVTMGRDGHTPTAFRAVVWTHTGRGYELAGSCEVSSVSTHDGDYFATDAYGRFSMGGRVGGGLLSVRERAEPSSEHRAWLGRFDGG
jgi:hypothetical protein